MAQISSTIRSAVAKYVRALNQSGIRVQRVLLYGSHVKNVAHADSDIDLIIFYERDKAKVADVDKAIEKFDAA
ncbi:MAG: nucleotidyltransferase domain-containing protein, partial [bacterium]